MAALAYSAATTPRASVVPRPGSTARRDIPLCTSLQKVPDKLDGKRSPSGAQAQTHSLLLSGTNGIRVVPKIARYEVFQRRVRLRRKKSGQILVKESAQSLSRSSYLVSS